MKLKIYKDYETLSLQAANEIVHEVKQKPNAVLCLAAGDTPRLAYTLLVKQAVENNIDFSQVTFIGLDEWVGIPPENAGSCHFFLRSHVFDQLHIHDEQIHLFNAMATDLFLECSNMDNVIAEKGGIDLMMVGVGMNGHIGFNEPGVAFDLYSHIIELDDTTQKVGQKYFSKTTELKLGISLGLSHLSESKKVILIANGARKAPVIREALEKQIHSGMPASIMRSHEQGIIMLDEEAASLLEPGTISIFVDEN